MSITFFMGAGPAVKPVRHFYTPTGWAKFFLVLV